MAPFPPGSATGSSGSKVATPIPVKITHKKMADKGSRIDFMFSAPHPAAGSATGGIIILLFVFLFVKNLCKPQEDYRIWLSVVRECMKSFPVRESNYTIQ